MHRDIKSSNVLICKDKNGNLIYKLANFDLSKILLSGNLILNIYSLNLEFL